jgi:hypothetical protein
MRLQTDIERYKIRKTLHVVKERLEEALHLSREKLEEAKHARPTSTDRRR